MKFIFYFGIFLGICRLWANSYEDLGEGILIQRNYDLNKEGKKIAIVTAIISGKDQQRCEYYKTITYQEIVAFGTKSKEIYAKKHGFDFIIATKKLKDCHGIQQNRDLECAWTKLALIARIIDDYDWVFWTDADSAILNFSTKLENFINEDFDVIACTEKITNRPIPFPSKGAINTGQVLYKNCPFSKDLILSAWCNHHKKTPGSFEQARINTILREDPEKAKHVLVHSAKAFNLHPSQYEKGDFLIHMYAMHGRELYLKFQEIEKKYGRILKKEEKLPKYLHRQDLSAFE